MQRSWLVAAAGLLVLLALGPSVPGQAPGPVASLALSLPAGPVEIPLGGGHAVPLEVTLALENLVCPQASTATVALAVRDLPSPLAGVRASAADVAIEIPPGAYPSTNPFSGTGQGALDIQVGSDALSEHAHEFEVTAAFTGGTPAGCVAAGSFPAAEAVANHRIVTGPSPSAAGPAPTTADAPAPGASSGNGPGAPAPRSTPGPGLALLAGAAAAAAMALRRR